MSIDHRVIESWRYCWRAGVAPCLSTKALLALRQALETNDARLIQGHTTSPPPMAYVADWPCEGGCLLGFAGMAEGLETVGEVEAFFARMAFEIDARLGEPSGCRMILGWYDDTPREQVAALLIPEIDLCLAGRATAAAG